jgi:ribA/ribD-fused uncharacterized protein
MHHHMTQVPPETVRPIDRFAGPYAFLSNYHPSAVQVDGASYPSVEHAFQAAKTDDAAQREAIRRAPTPGGAKRLGRSVRLRPNWDRERNQVMRRLVVQKFTRHHALGEQLLATRNRALIEGNHWGDRYWGMCDGVGENHLGHILMEVRAQLASARDEHRGRTVPADDDPSEEVIVGYDVRLYVHVEVAERRIARAVVDASTIGDPTAVIEDDSARAAAAVAVCEDRATQWPRWEIT